MFFLGSKRWFPLSIFAVVYLARKAPWIGQTGGPLQPELTVKYGAVSAIFFTSGLTLPVDDLSRTIRNARLHALVQSFALVLMPGLMLLLRNTLVAFNTTRPELAMGFLVLGCMPPPVSSAVILTKSAAGNEAAAIFNSALGSLLGIFVTPMLLLKLVGVSAAIPHHTIGGQLACTVLLPLCLGQAVRQVYWDSSLQHMHIPFGEISNLILLVIIYTTFCDSFSRPLQVHAADLITVVSCAALLLLFVTALSFTVGNMARLAPRDTVAMVFCSTHKSLTLGMPILRLLYANDPILPYISLPLLCWHPMQILLGGVFAPALRSWLHQDKALPALHGVISPIQPLASPRKKLSKPELMPSDVGAEPLHPSTN